MLVFKTFYLTLRSWLSGRRRVEISSGLIARYSHEVRTSLTGIIGYAEFLETGSNEPMMNFTAKIIRESGLNLTHTSNAFLDLHNLHRGELRLSCTRFVFSDLVREVVQKHREFALEREVGCGFSCDESASLKTVSTDIDRMRQVVNALVLNIVQMLGKWSVVHIELSYSNAYRSWILLFSMSDASENTRAMKLFKSFWCDENYNYMLQDGPGVVLAAAKAMLYLLGGSAKFDDASETLPSRLSLIFPSY